jgi:hypothetical protein
MAYIPLANVESQTDKIDQAATDGLLGTNNSLAYRTHEIEKHFHSFEHWFGVAASPSGETHVADVVGGATTAFALVSGASTFGSWVQMLGSSDTPVLSGYANFDPHRYLITTTDSTSPFILQFATGESAGLATKISNSEYSSFMYISASNNNDSGVEDMMSPRITTGEKVWVRVACIGQTGKTLNGYFGIHEYIG